MQEFDCALSVATSEMSVSLRVEQRIKESGKEVKTVTIAALEYVYKSAL